MKTKDIIKRADENHAKSIKELKESLERHKDFKILSRVLGLTRDQSYKIFGCDNDTVEDMLSLESMLVNGLLDDATLGIVMKGEGIFCHPHVSWGNDDFMPCVSEDDLNKMIDIVEAQGAFYKKFDAEINSVPRNDEFLREYFKFANKLTEFALSLATKEIQDKHASEHKIYEDKAKAMFEKKKQ